MSSSEDEFPVSRDVIVRDHKAERAAAAAKAKAVAEFVADEEEADFIPSSREQSIRNSKRLADMAVESNAGRVRATAYLGVGMKAVEKRKKKAKKIESAKKQKQKDSRKLHKAVESLFSMKSPPTQTPTSTSSFAPTKRSKDFEPVSIQTFAPVSTPKGISPTNRSALNVTTPSTISSIATSVTEDSNFICRGCGNNRSMCHEVKYRNFCLHAVLDYFELVGMDFSTQHGIKDAFTVAYTSAVKKDLLERHQFYERNREVELPDCIEEGALQDAFYLRSSRRLLQFLLAKRVYDIPSQIQNMTDSSVESRFFPDYENQS